MLKVGLVGVGGISATHIKVWENLVDCELVALCDIRPERMDKYDNKRKYTSFDEMLENEKLDILDICLPTYLHADYAVKAMEKKINVICEKPISLKLEDVDRVYSCADKNGVCFMVAHVIRFWPEFLFIKELHENGKYGKLLSGTMSRLGAFPGWTWDGWMTDEKRSGLVPYDLHIHDLDFLIYAFGAPNNMISNRSKMPDQDYFNCVYEFDGFFISVEAAWYASSYPFTSYFRFQYENAVVSTENGALTVYERGGKKYCPFEGDQGVDEENPGIPKSNAYGNEIIYFVDCVKNGKKAEIVKSEELKTCINLLNII